MEDYKAPWLFKLLVFVLFLFLLLPVILVFPISFSSDQYLVFPPSGFSLQWYEKLFANELMMQAFYNSTILGVVVTTLSIAIALPAAYAIVRLKPVGGEFLFNLFTAPLLLPGIVLGLAVLIVFAPFKLLGTPHAIVLGHMIITVPYALRILATSLQSVPSGIEEAASSLGARPWTVFRRVTLPVIKPGIIAATAITFIISFDEVVVTLFLAGPQTTTLPIELYRHVSNNVDPLVAAASVILIALTMVIVLAVERSMGLSKTFVRAKG